MLAGSTKQRRLQRATVGGTAAAASADPPTPVPGDGDSGLGAPCLGSAMGTYFGLAEVNAALGIPADNNFIVLDNGIGFNYTTDASFVGDVYKKAIGQGKRVLIYEGDSDACGLQTAPIEDIWVPFMGNGTRASDNWTPAGVRRDDISPRLNLRDRTTGHRPGCAEIVGHILSRRGVHTVSARWTHDGGRFL
jgi:hypothetical protein